MMENDLISRDALYKAWDALDETQDANLLIDAMIKATQDALAVDAEPVITGETSDGYHTFNELYHHRAVLFSVIVKAFPERAWKARQHHDGTMYEGMFIVGIDTPYGQASYHYNIEPYWNMFACRELERAPEWDGHTPAQAIERIGRLVPMRHGKWSKGRKIGDVWCCSECGFGQLVSASFMYKKGCIGHTDNRTRFCPNCGARMGAEVKE